MALDPEDELKEYRSILRDLTLKDPEIKREWQKLLKKVRPNAVTPDLDADERLNAKLGAEKKVLEDRIEKLEAERIKKELEEKLNSEKAALRGPPFNFDDEDLIEVEKLVKEGDYVSWTSAAKYYKAANAPARPSGLGLGGSARSKSAKQERQDFNDRFKGVFRKPGNSKYQEKIDDAFEKIRTGQYLKE